MLGAWFFNASRLATTGMPVPTITMSQSETCLDASTTISSSKP